MRYRVAHKLSFSRTALLAVAATAALVGPIAMGVVNATSGAAQSETAAQNSTEGTPAFQVATVRLDPNGPQGRPVLPKLACAGSPVQIDGARFAITAYPYTLISMAYGRPGYDWCYLADLFISGPEWIRSDRYAIQATMPEGTPSYTPIQFGGRNARRLQMMLQSLLADRFKLKVHWDMKDISVHVLTAGTSVNLTASNEADVGWRTQRTLTRRLDQNGHPYGDLVVGKASMEDLALMLGQVVGGLVQDKTGITGRFYVTLEFDNNGVARPTLAAALQKIGLKLEAKEVRMEVLVIDSVERPFGN
jgi:uncharacterized protein (TIGR03435 family)